MAVIPVQPVRIEDPDEPFLKQAGEVALEFINLRTQNTLSSAKKAPHYPKKAAGAQGGQQQQRQTNQATGQAAALQLTANSAGGPPVSPSRRIAERLKAIGDEVDEDLDDKTKAAFLTLFSRVTPFTMNREDFTSACSGILSTFNKLFRTGWQQISFVYNAMFQVVLAVREDGGDIQTEMREQQISNFVGPTLTDLGLYQWMANHGGMDNFGSPVEGEDATAIIDSSVDPEPPANQ